MPNCISCEDFKTEYEKPKIVYMCMAKNRAIATESVRQSAKRAIEGGLLPFDSPPDWCPKGE